jgi:WD40 repeat protein
MTGPLFLFFLAILTDLLSFCNTAKHIASGGVDDTVQIWDAMTGQKQLFTKNNTDDILEVAWSSDGKRLASASKDQKLQVSVLHF